MFVEHPEGGFELAPNVQRYCKHLREIASGRGGSAGEQLSIERAKLAKEQSDKAAMENAVRRGELLELDRVVEEYAEDLGELREGLYVIPSKIGEECATMTPGEIAQYVAQLIDDALLAMRSPEAVAGEVQAEQMGESEGRA